MSRIVLLLILLLCFQLPSITTAQRSSDARLLYLDDDCTTCITVDADAGESTVLVPTGCQTARTRDKFWILSDVGNGFSTWCLDDNPSLCVEEGGDVGDDRLRLKNRSSNRWQIWDFSTLDDGGEAGQIISISGDCVTLWRSRLRMRPSGTKMRKQLWQQLADRVPCTSSGSNTNDGTLIFMHRDCNECLGVVRSADNEALTIVECDDSSAIRQWTLEYLEREGTNIVRSWCLAENKDLCIAEVGNDLRLRDDSADTFIFKNNLDDEIISVGDFNKCLTRMGRNVVMDTCRYNADQRWTTQGQEYWDMVSRRCVHESGGIVIYNKNQCGVCIVASDTGTGSALVEGDCDVVEDERKRFTFGEGYWCLQSNENVCVEADFAGRLTLRGKSNEQRQEWVYDKNRNEIQPLVSSDICVAHKTGATIELETCNRISGAASAWMMADYDRKYQDDCTRITTDSTGRCKVYGDLFALDADCNLCIGVGSGEKLVAVDCTNAMDAVKTWDFSNTGLWRLADDPALCVGADLRLQDCVEGKQSLRWTYSDVSQIGNTGQRKIARWSSPYECIAQQGLESSTLILTSCRKSPTAFNLDWDYATNTCDYNCIFDDNRGVEPDDDAPQIQGFDDDDDDRAGKMERDEDDDDVDEDGNIATMNTNNPFDDDWVGKVTPSENTSGGYMYWSTGMIVGIAVGAFVAVCLLWCLIKCYCCRKKDEVGVVCQQKSAPKSDGGLTGP